MTENVYPESTTEAPPLQSELASALAEVQRSIAKAEVAAAGPSPWADRVAAEELRESAARFVAAAQSSLAHHPRPADLGYLFRPVLPVFLVVGNRFHAAAFRDAHGLRAADVVCALATSESGDWFRVHEVRRVELVFPDDWVPMAAKDVAAANVSLARAATLNERNGWPVLEVSA